MAAPSPRFIWGCIFVREYSEKTASPRIFESLGLNLHIHDVGIGLHHAVSHMEGGLEPHLGFLH